MVALHGWSAVLLGLLLYAVVATGTVAVLSEEIEHWSVGHVAQGNPLTTDVDGAVRDIAKTVNPEFLEDIGIGRSPRGNLQLFFHTHRKKDNGQIEEYGIQYEIEPRTREVLQERKGTGQELFNSDPHNALSRFLVSIHTELHLPRPWGLLLTGILGLAMLVAAVSGFMMHRHLFEDMFVLRRDRNAVTVKRDVHTVAGTWGLPFAFILAFTGCFFSFAGSFGLSAMAMVAFGGDQEALIRTVIGVPETESDQQMDTVNLNHVIDDGYQRRGAYPEFAAITHYGRGDAKITLFMPPLESRLEPAELQYNGTNGEFIREKPTIGTVPSLGSSVFSLIGPLHFGDFAGLLSKAVWVALGFASCYVILSGFSLWLVRRRENHKWRMYERFTVVFGHGLPVVMLIAGAAYFAAQWFHANTNVFVPWSFSIASILCILSGFIVKDIRLIKQALLGLSAALCLSLPVLRLIAGGPFWFSAMQNRNMSVVVIDVLLVLLAIYCVHQFKRSFSPYATAAADVDDGSGKGKNLFQPENV